MSFDGIVWPETGSSVLEYIREKEKLLEILQDAQIPLSYRPFLFDRQTVRFEKNIRNRNPNMQQITGQLWTVALRSRLLILDHYSTPFHEAMAANIPTIVIWSAQATGISLEASPIFDRLRACGVLFDSPEAAAAAAIRVWPDVQAWWRGADVQAARQAFCYSHARASRWWFFSWLQKCAGI
jgi:putative transferase (TIGR04331 family)